MKLRYLPILALTALAAALPQAGATPWMGAGHPAAAPDGSRIYVLETENSALRALPVSLDDPGTSLSLPGRPHALLVHPDGRLFVAVGGTDGQILEIAPDLSAIVNTYPVGHTPSALALDPAGQRLFVANRFDDEIAVLDLASGATVASIGVDREPVSLAVASGKLWIANLLPVGPADTADIYSEISVIDLASLERGRNIKLPNGATALANLTASPDGDFVYATHILARYHVPTTQVERGWMNTNALSVIDAAQARHVNTVLLDEPQRGAANPGALAVTGDGSEIAVVIQGTHEIILIDRETLHRNLNLAAAGKPHRSNISRPDQVPNDLSFLSGYRTRVTLPGNGPRGIAVLPDKVLTALRYSDQLAALELPGNRVRHLDLNPDLSLSAEQAGESAFHDAAYCFQQWQSCATCHPGQGRADALNWDLLNDGMGNPKQTKSLLLAHLTPPVMISGIRDDYTVANRAGFRHIQFVVPPAGRVENVDAYVASLKPVPSPHLVDGELSESARRGQAIFAEARCKFCHSGELFTNLKSYDVGTGGISGDETPLDTPTLIEVWRTAPYLKDGRAATIMEVLTTFNPKDQHGHTSDLTEAELQDLATYVLSL